MENPNAVYDYNLVRIFFDEVDERPALVIASKSKARKNAFVIPLDSAYKYTSDEYLVEQAKKVCEMMTLGTHKNTVYRIADLIMNHLEELVRMVPDVADQKRPEDDGVEIFVG